MPSQTTKSRFPISLYATPSPAHRDVFYTVLRAGHLIGGPEHRVRRDHFPGHELLLCLRGRGYVRVAGRTHHVSRGEFVWINCRIPHEHGALKSDPWEVLWIRIEGPRLEAMCNILSITVSPVFNGFDRATAVPVFREIFRLMKSDAPGVPAFIHAAVARLLALAFAARQQHGDSGPVIPLALARPVERMKLFFFERHTVAALAKLAGMSPTHFARVFKAAFGTSPIDWLRRERISQAKRRLAETNASIKEIAGQSGYTDRYFFSKDFKRHTGLTPREFRRREANAPGV
jgi:AraC family transcriptional regulator, arabinose operon regulatory protein